MNYLKKTLKILGLIIVFVVGLGLLIIGWFYATCPVYQFDEPKPFSGKNIYNPYQNAQPNQWKKSIFHCHSKSWGGITDGVKNTKEQIDSVYKALQFDVITISNYMTYDKPKDECEITAYEHGYNIRKTHQLAMGYKKPVLYRDYFFPHGLSQKQHIIDLLKERCEVVAINHPDLRDGYYPEEFKYLCGYDLFELLNGARISDDEWDSALSYGHPAWLTANDDSHNVHKSDNVHLEVLFINSPTTCKEDIFKNLTTGNAFGVHFPDTGQSIPQKQIESTQVTYPKKIEVQNDTLFVTWEVPLNEIRFYGQNGNLVKRLYNTDSAFYEIHPEDTYIRTQLYSKEGFVYYLNPVVRCSGDMPQKQFLASVDITKTTIKRVVIGVAVLGILSIFVVLKKRKKQRTINK